MLQVIKRLQKVIPGVFQNAFKTKMSTTNASMASPFEVKDKDKNIICPRGDEPEIKAEADCIHKEFLNRRNYSKKRFKAAVAKALKDHLSYAITEKN